MEYIRHTSDHFPASNDKKHSWTGTSIRHGSSSSTW
jgi:hypothetical protein